MLVDCHIHTTGNESSTDVIADMDAAGVDRAIMISPYGSLVDHVSLDSGGRMNSEQQTKSVDFISDLIAAAPDRIAGFAWIEPLLPDAADQLRRAVDKGCRGCKMIPHHWYPYEERIFPVYETALALAIPILFHSGILWGHGDSSRFCRPVFYEVMVNFPKIRFALAHIGWPWTDECTALAGRFRSHAQRHAPEAATMYIDTTRGTPEFYRKPAIDKVIQYLGTDHLMFGSDSMAGKLAGRADSNAERDRIILDELGVDDAGKRAFFASNALRFIGEPDS